MSWLLECGGKQHGGDVGCQWQFNTENTFVKFRPPPSTHFGEGVIAKSAPSVLLMALAFEKSPEKWEREGWGGGWLELGFFEKVFTSKRLLLQSANARPHQHNLSGVNHKSLIEDTPVRPYHRPRVTWPPNTSVMYIWFPEYSKPP